MTKSDYGSECGYSLIELMIVLVILGVVSAGVYSSFDSGQKEYSTREATIRMQQQARLAMINLEKDLKKIGYGFVSLGNLKVNAYSGGAVTTWSMVDCTNNTVDATINNAANTDTIAFRFYNGALDVASDVTLRTDHPLSSANTPVSSSDGFNDGDFFIIFDPNDAAKPASMLEVNPGTSNAGGGDSVIHNHGGGASAFNPPGDELFPIGGYPIGSVVLNLGGSQFYWLRYYVDANRNLIQLTQQGPSAAVTRRVIAAGVEDLQLKYLFKDGQWLDAPVNLDANHDINNLRAVRVSILVRAVNPDPKFGSTAAFQLTGDNGNGVSYSGGGYRRMILSSIISLRNMTIRK